MINNYEHRGVLSFRIQISPLCSECPIPCPPLSELSSYNRTRITLIFANKWVKLTKILGNIKFLILLNFILN